MEERESLAHVRWECKYHVVIIPKYCAGQLRFRSPFVRLFERVRRRVSGDCSRPTGMGANAGGDHRGSRANRPPKEVVSRRLGGYHE
jgi:hypothetical protein